MAPQLGQLDAVSPQAWLYPGAQKESPSLSLTLLSSALAGKVTADGSLTTSVPPGGGLTGSTWSLAYPWICPFKSEDGGTLIGQLESCARLWAGLSVFDLRE